MSEATKKTSAFDPRASGQEDAILIGKCRNGDQLAWDDLIDKYQRLVFTIPRRAGLSESQSADILQEVFLTLFQKLDTIGQPERIRSWLVTTSKFKSWALIRKDKGKYSPTTDEEMEAEMSSLTDQSPLADESLVKQEEQHLISPSLTKLEERCQKILSMIYLTEPAASYADVAKAIGVGTTSISTLRSRCLKKLERILIKS